MKKYLSLLFVALCISSCATADHPARKVASAEAEMEYVDVCNRQNECKKFSRIIMGTDHLIQADWAGDGKSEMNEKQVQEILDEAVKLGINFFDTSPIYVGSVEYALGKWMSSRSQSIIADGFYYNNHLNPDRRLYALSKGGFPFDLYYSKRLEPGAHSETLRHELLKQGILRSIPRIGEDAAIQLDQVPPGTYASRLYGSREQITHRVSEEMGHSYANLGSFLTIYLMHRDDGDFIRFKKIPRESTPVRTIMEALSAEELVARYWMVGWSNWGVDRINESLDLASHSSKLPQPGFNSAYFSLFEMSSRTIHAGGVQVTHQEMNNPEFQKGIRQMSYSPLGGFSIMDKPEPRWKNAKKAAKEKYDRGDPYWQNIYPSIFTEENQARYERVVEFTKKFNREHNTDYTLDQVINAYALAHRRADFLTIGPVTIEQLRRTVGSLKLSKMLTEADLEYLHRGN